jgi:hypothetical protein
VLFVLIVIWMGSPRAPWPLLLALAVALYLTVVELRELKPPSYLWWSWWLLLVFMLHFPAYLALRVYSFYVKRQAKRART